MFSADRRDKGTKGLSPSSSFKILSVPPGIPRPVLGLNYLMTQGFMLKRKVQPPAELRSWDFLSAFHLQPGEL